MLGIGTSSICWKHLIGPTGLLQAHIEYIILNLASHRMRLALFGGFADECEAWGELGIEAGDGMMALVWRLV